MHIKKLKVRKQKARFQPLCAAEMSSMLACWATQGDLQSIGKCAEKANQLHECMRTTAMNKKKPAATINYHLARLQKVLR